MDVRDRVRHLVEEIPPLPEGDPAATFDAGRRRVRRRRTLTASGAAAAAIVVAVALVALPGTATRQPSIGDSPDADTALVPAGWRTITAGQIAVSVPPDWEIHHPYEDLEPPAGASLGGPCHTDLYRAQGRGDDAQPPSPVAVVYDRPTDGVCPAIGIDGPPPRPGLVLYETIRGTVDGVEEQPGLERVDIEEQGVRDRIGQLEVWRTVDDEPTRDLVPSGIVSYVPVDLQGGLWVSHPDDPTVQRILATARPASTSQSAEDAARDGVLPEVAALPYAARVEIVEVDQPLRTTTDEGVWVVSRLTSEEASRRSNGCGIGATEDPDAVYRRDVICTVEYGELLLLDHEEGRILRAYPLPGLPPEQLLVTDEAVYCARSGDGALPDGMLCRIDRDTLDAHVRIFPAQNNSAFDPDIETIWLPPSWTIDDQPNLTPGELSYHDGRLLSTREGVTTAISAETLTPTDR